MYIIENITDKQNNTKQEFIDELKKSHKELKGEILKCDTCLCFSWNDNSNKMLKTSSIENISYKDNMIVIETRNSIYYLREVK